MNISKTEFSPLARQSLASIVPYEPGKPISEVQREYNLTQVVKLASNENPLGASPKAVAAIHAALDDLRLYPDGACYYLKKKLSQKLGVPQSHIVMGNGSTELVELITEAFIEPGDEAVIGQFEFFKYRIAMQIMGGTTVWANMPGLEYDLEELLGRITPRTKLLFIANPNNPTGTYMNRAAVDELMRRVPGHVVVVFDEAYYEYRPVDSFPDTLQFVAEGRNVIVLRTFSKAYGLAGLRVGYAITPPPIAGAMNRVRETFNVNALGQVGALAALDDEEFIARGLQLNADGKRYFYAGLDRLGIEYVPSEANFVLIRTYNSKPGYPHASIYGRDLFQQLLKRGVVVRPVDGYGLKEYVRVSIGLPEENAMFFREFEQLL